MCRKHLKNTSPSEHEDGLVLFGFGFLDKIMASRFMILGKNAIGQISKISPLGYFPRNILAVFFIILRLIGDKEKLNTVNLQT